MVAGSVRPVCFSSGVTAVSVSEKQEADAKSLLLSQHHLGCICLCSDLSVWTVDCISLLLLELFRNPFEYPYSTQNQRAGRGAEAQKENTSWRHNITAFFTEGSPKAWRLDQMSRQDILLTIAPEITWKKVGKWQAIPMSQCIHK